MCYGKRWAVQAIIVKHIHNWVTRAYCHKVLRLSAATQDLPKSIICNVHGVNPKFLRVGEKVAVEREQGQKVFSTGAYFVGKMVWANLRGRDHVADSLHSSKVFIDPSVSDVLCTATVEALAMGKFVVCANHPSNDFFWAFLNCLTSKTSNEFVAIVKEAVASEPQHLTPEQTSNLSWAAATPRFMESSELDNFLNRSTDNSHPAVQHSSDKKKTVTSMSWPSGWVLLVSSLIFMAIMYTWTYGPLQKHAFDVENRVSMKRFLASDSSLGMVCVPGMVLRYSDLITGAALVAKKAYELGLEVKPWIKTSLGPGSGVVTKYLQKSGLQKYLDQQGVQIVGYGCTTCIGNSGDLDESVASAITANDIIAAAVLSRNRNFEACRIHEDNPAATCLLERGVDRKDFNSLGSLSKQWTQLHSAPAPRGS